MSDYIVSKMTIKGPQTRFPGLEVFQEANGLWSITAFRIVYLMPESICESLYWFWKREGASFPDVLTWYCGLAEDQKRQMARFDIEQNKYL